VRLTAASTFSMPRRVGSITVAYANFLEAFMLTTPAVWMTYLRQWGQGPAAAAVVSWRLGGG
jgi:hypothetical protein